MTWQWEYVPDEETVAAGAPPAFIVEVEKKAEELVRAAQALHLHGPSYQGADEGAKHAFVDGGFFVYMITPRTELVSIWQITIDPIA
ncbi:hypothetical protein AB0D57_16925 [Streptomyces sp. NPDC048275]|uniref:hypothetical protein n=1 Tax=Streptomyces sp. NPDC048275 TaxID=3155629 RepID=UPI00340354D6